MIKNWIAGVLAFVLLAAGCGVKTDDSSQTEDSQSTSIEEMLPQEEEKRIEEKEIQKQEEESDQEVIQEEETQEVVKEDIDVEVDRDSLRAQLAILQDPDMYTYDQMLADTDILMQLYPGRIKCDSIGKTADGREILHYIVGNPSAEKQIFINGAIHAREYLTFQLVMKQMCVYLQHIDQGDFWGDYSYQDMWDKVAVHVVPLVNPDGVQISQFGLDGLQNESIKEGIYQLAENDGTELTSYYLEHWKANAEGVDLNRNFDAYWEYYQGTGYPSSDHYKGSSPGSASEAAALISLTERNNFLYTISYHTQGQVIYWNFENIDPIYDISLQWVNRLTEQTGYYQESNFSTVDPAGYSDWAIYRKQIPSVVIEIALGESPYLSSQFQQVWQENLNVWEITLEEAMNR